jgi:hypothetical protein
MLLSPEKTNGQTWLRLVTFPAVLSIIFLVLAIGGEVRMSDNPIDVIEAAIRSAFTNYPKEDDPDWRSPHWIMPEECTHLAQGIMLELQAKGFEIVRKAA